MLEDLFATSCREIEAAYHRQGHRLGWRFVTGPKSAFRAGVDVALISQNPGGDFNPSDHLHASSEKGSAYIVESWGSMPPGSAPLQIQVRKLFAELAHVLGESSGDELLSRSLTAYFVPFRSPSFHELASPRQSTEFARQLWMRLLPLLSPRITVALGKRTTTSLAEILTLTLGPPSVEALPTGWGKSQAELYRFQADASARILLGMPHLSRFKLFGRSQSAPYLVHPLSLFRPPPTDTATP